MMADDGDGTMKQLWAPWRMAYINQPGSPADEGCFLCAKARQHDEDAANFVLARGKRCFVIMNLYPYNNGHLMIAPYQHLPTIEHLKAPVLTEMMVLAQRCLAALRAAMHPDGFNMGINQGRVAGAGLEDHVHYHIVPRWNGDTNFMPVLGETKVMPDFLENTYRQVHAALLPLMEPAQRARK
jgi:ATP adenylyltransferase